jgi:hypothetical protein
MTDSKSNGKSEFTIEELLKRSDVIGGVAMALGPDELLAIRYSLKHTVLDLASDPPKGISSKDLGERIADLVSIQRKISEMLGRIAKTVSEEIAEKVEGMTPEEVRKIVSEGLDLELKESD